MLDIFIICVCAHINLWEKYPQNFTYYLWTRFNKI